MITELDPSGNHRLDQIYEFCLSDGKTIRTFGQGRVFYPSRLDCNSSHVVALCNKSARVANHETHVMPTLVVFDYVSGNMTRRLSLDGFVQSRNSDVRLFGASSIATADSSLRRIGVFGRDGTLVRRVDPDVVSGGEVELYPSCLLSPHEVDGPLTVASSGERWGSLKHTYLASLRADGSPDVDTIKRSLPPSVDGTSQSLRSIVSVHALGAERFVVVDMNGTRVSVHHHVSGSL